MAKPLVLTKENVLATMEGRKTQTRRIINPQPVYVEHEDEGGHWEWKHYQVDTLMDLIEFAKYQVGDEVYVAEGYQVTKHFEKLERAVSGIYLADHAEFHKQLTKSEYSKWLKRKRKYRPTSGRFMYKSLARTFMTITEVRVERLWEISQEDAFAEGCRGYINGKCLITEKAVFHDLWNYIHGDGAWELNPCVFCYKYSVRGK